MSVLEPYVCRDGHPDCIVSEDDMALIAAAPEMFGVLADGPSLPLPQFLEWIADRLVQVHGDPAAADFVLSLRERASRARAAIAKAEGR